jgi:hypothetical protein
MARPKFLISILYVLVSLAACNSKPKPVSNNIHRQAVTVNGKKDSVINNSRQNYGDVATVPDVCIKCLLAIIQQTGHYQKFTLAVPSQNIIYNINWITSSNPVDIDSSLKINNGMSIKLQLKDGGSPKMLATYLYNNQNARFYLLNTQNKYDEDVKVDSASLKSIRQKCFWGVASAK